MTNHPGTSRPRPARWSLTKRGGVTLVALASCAAVALPAGSAQASPVPQLDRRTAVTTTSVATPAAKPAAVAPGGTATTAATSSWYNTVRYNKLYKYGGPVGVSTCHEPRNQLNRLEPIKAYHTYFVACLSKAWIVNFRKAGISFHSPKVVYYSSSIETGCGKVTGQAYFCSAYGGRIFIPWTVYVGWWRQNSLWARTFIAQTIAHEYGHHVQYLSGVLQASWNRQLYLFKTSADKLQENRRRELQATCMGGAYLGADRSYFPMSGSFLTEWRWTVSHMGDSAGYPRDHGNYTNNSYWATRGFTYHTSGTCIPWSAPNSRVA
jgi:hypothetical protein